MGKGKNRPWLTAFSVSSVAFGIHVGGGFATGNQTANFFVKYGWTAAFLPVIAMLILNLVFRSALINAQVNGTSNYRAWANKAFKPIDKLMGPVFEICLIIIYLMAVASSIAGAASVLETEGVNYTVGIIVTAIVFFVLVLFGKDLIAKAGTVMTVIIVVCSLVLYYFALTSDGADLASAVSTSNQPLGFWPAVWSMLTYVGFLVYTGGMLSAYATDLGDVKGINRFTVVNFILNASMLLISTLVVMAWAGKVANTTIPILEITNYINGGPVLHVLYSVALCMAFISTGVGCTFGSVSRFETLMPAKLSIMTRRAIAGGITVLISLGVSTFGLTAIVAKGYGCLGVVGIFVMIIPAFTLIAHNNRVGMAAKKAAGKAE